MYTFRTKQESLLVCSDILFNTINDTEPSYKPGAAYLTLFQDDPHRW